MDINTVEIVKKHNFRFTKSLGQNFLKDKSVLEDIIESSDIKNTDHIVEIGPGVGTLTRELLEKAGKVTAIEIDEKLIPILNEELGSYDNLNIIKGDAIKLDLENIFKDEKIKFVCNLPYYATTPIIARILNSDLNFESLTIMIQKEVAQRINAEPATKEYGALTILVKYFTDVSIIREVKPNSFIPMPKVHSTVIKLTKLSEPRSYVKDEKLFFDIVRHSFNMRRKTLVNGLKSMGYNKDLIEKVFSELGFDFKIRGETLSISEFAMLSNKLKESN